MQGACPERGFNQELRVGAVLCWGGALRAKLEVLLSPVSSP